MTEGQGQAGAPTHSSQTLFPPPKTARGAILENGLRMWNEPRVWLGVGMPGQAVWGQRLTLARLMGQQKNPPKPYTHTILASCEMRLSVCSCVYIPGDPQSVHLGTLRRQQQTPFCPALLRHKELCCLWVKQIQILKMFVQHQRAVAHVNISARIKNAKRWQHTVARTQKYCTH